MRTRTSLSALLFVFAASIASASASPLISIGDGGEISWSDAVASGNVIPAPNPLGTGASQQFYNTQIGVNMFGVPVTNILPAVNIQLYPGVTLSDAAFGGSTTKQSLVMAWEHSPSANDGTLTVAAWDYVYDVDPNLSGQHIKFSILPPPQVWDFSLELIDSLGRGRGWFGVPPSTTWGDFTIWADVLGPQGPFGAFFEDPGFDITSVVRIRLNESSQFGIGFAVFPVVGGPVIPPGQPWNAWDRLLVPEPATLTVLGLGLVGMGLARRRRG